MSFAHLDRIVGIGRAVERHAAVMRTVRALERVVGPLRVDSPPIPPWAIAQLEAAERLFAQHPAARVVVFASRHPSRHHGEQP